jgi:NodT family efflux transporter outer membrane factor (OMF) lipoprotein
MRTLKTNKPFSSEQPTKLNLVHRNMFKKIPFVIGISISLLLTACAVGPTYERPQIQEAAQFKENRGWLQLAPLTTQSQGEWWTIFGDETLNTLEPRVAKANQSLRVSYYAYQQALALTRGARAAEFPNVGASISAIKSSPGPAGGTINTDTAGITASWAPDFWGKVRLQVEANEASAEASWENLLAAQLSLQATLAQSYFQIRQLDSQTSLAQDTVTAFDKSLQLTQNRYAAGVATKADVAQAQLQVSNSRVQLAAFTVQRAQLEHAIAVLIGEAPSNFNLPPVATLVQSQVVPAGLPSQLLLRRPDLIAAERQLVAANAQIGVAESAYFPSLTLSAQGGWRSSTFSNLISAPNEFWSIGPSLAATLFDGGARGAQIEQSKSAYQQVVAQYRQLSLQAFQQVEDQLVALFTLAEEAQLQQQSVDAADESLRLSTNAYKAGTVSYLNVIIAQTAAYTARNSALQISGQRLTASVALIQALGGKWGAEEQPAQGAESMQKQSDAK